MANLEERPTRVVARKKLPWLDGPRTVPGQFDSKESLGLGDTQEHLSAAGSNQPPANTIEYAQKLDGDPALRATGSTPSLRDAHRRKDGRSLSVSSQPRNGMRPFHTKRRPPGKLRIVNECQGMRDDASSLYGASTPPTEGEGPAQPLSNVDSYERLIDRFPLSTAATHRDSYRGTNSTLDALDSPVSPKAQRRSIPAEQAKVLRRQSRAARQYAGWDDIEPSGPSRRRQTRMSVVPTSLPVQEHSELPTLERKPTLFAMPSHLLGSSLSSSPGYVPKSQKQSIAPPAPLLPSIPSRAETNTRQLRRQSRSLSRAVTGLENLMQEALTIAKDAAHHGSNDDVAEILDSATTAIRRASTVHGRMQPGRMSQPLVLSPAASERGSDSDSEVVFSDASSTLSHHSDDTAPTFVTKSAQSSRPILVEQQSSKAPSPRSMKASIESISYPQPSTSPGRQSISRTPPQLYQPVSADSIVKDFAYTRTRTSKSQAARKASGSQGAAGDYYGEVRQSLDPQQGLRPSMSASMNTGFVSNSGRPISPPAMGPSETPKGPKQHLTVRNIDPVPTLSIPPRTSSRTPDTVDIANDKPRRRRERPVRPQSHLSDFFESSYYHQHPKGRPTEGVRDSTEKSRGGNEASWIADTRYATIPSTTQDIEKSRQMSETTRYSAQDPSADANFLRALKRNISLRHPRRNHLSLREGEGFSLGRHHRRQPIAREWNTFRKRITATIACLNTVFVGLIAGIYAGEVPRIQYQLADTTHKVILGNVLLFACLGATTLLFWPLPLLHGRKPYTLVSFAILLPLMFPQAVVVSSYRSPHNPLYRCGLLIPRAISGIAMGFANVNFLPTLFDLFGASLMSAVPHQEIVVYDDVRRQGGGVGIWLGIWSFCFVGSMSIGFAAGAWVISSLDPSWGFYLVVILLAFVLLVNVVAPETRRAPYRRSIAQFLDGEEKIKRRVARGEVLLHISNDGPRWWWEEVWAGVVLTKRMICQMGLFVLMMYLGWIYAQVTLVILLLGALLTRDYKWQPQYVAAAVLAVAVGAALAVPLSRANLFSRARDTPQRTDSMTMQAHHHHERVHWSSHMLRRCIFTLTLPIAAIAYALTSPGPPFNWTAPTIFCGLVGFLSNLAIAECVGIIMESFDTCDLQPGVNQKHRLQSMAETTRRRRTNYSSFPRICAGFFAAQSTGFFLSAAATGAAGDITRAVGAQVAVAITAAILLVLTVLFIGILWRWKAVQVIPNNAFGSLKGDSAWNQMAVNDPEWKPVIIGNPSGKMRRMNFLELGGLSRWTEIRRLNKLVRD